MTELSRDIPVDYDDARHWYGYQGKRYISATQIVEKFVNQFDAVEASIKYAAKNGMTPEYWRAHWEEINVTSKERGNIIHAAHEEVSQSNMIEVRGGTQFPVHNERISDWKSWYERPDGVYTERLCWHHGFQIAGRPDKVILFTANGERYADVDDYKTNKELKKKSYQNLRTGDYKMMKFPLQHIMDSNWWHYVLQLSIYMFMLEYQGFTPNKMRIIYHPHPYLDENGVKIIPPPEIHAVPYMKREVLMMLSQLKAA